MATISVKTFKESESTGGTYITPGIHEVKIESVEYKESSKGNPQLQFNIVAKDGRVLNQRITFTDNNMTKNMGDLIHIFKAQNLKEEFEQIEAVSFEAFAQMINKLLSIKGRPFFRMKFLGRANSSTGKVYTQIASWPPFAEALSTDPSTLVYNESENDVPSAPIQQVTDVESIEVPSEDDLPAFLR